MPAFPMVRIGMPSIPRRSHSPMEIAPHFLPSTPPASAQTKLCSVIGTAPMGNVNCDRIAIMPANKAALIISCICPFSKGKTFFHYRSSIQDLDAQSAFENHVRGASLTKQTIQCNRSRGAALIVSGAAHQSGGWRHRLR